MQVRLGRRGLALREQASVAVRAATAAVAAWWLLVPLGWLVGPWGQDVHDYGYYAPLGAVIGVSTTVFRSARTSAQTVAAIAVGSASTSLLSQAQLPATVLLPAVVAVAVMLSALPWLGPSGVWVPFTALFVLVIGDTERVEFVASYIGLTTLGAAVGVALTMAFPPVFGASARSSLADLRTTIADQLDDLAEGLRLTRPPSQSEWQERHRAVEAWARRAGRRVDRAVAARHANWRTSRHPELQGLDEQGRALRRLAHLVEDVTEMMTSHEHETSEDPVLGPALRPSAAAAFASTADVLRRAPELDEDARPLTRARRAVDELAAQTLRTQHDGVGSHAAVMVVTVLRDGLASVARCWTEGTQDRGRDG